MSTMFELLRNSRAATFAVTFAVLAQFAMLTHAVVDEHAEEEHCEICFVLDRMDDSVLPTEAAQPLVDAADTPHSVVVSSTAGSIEHDVRVRGPPSVISPKTSF